MGPETLDWLAVHAVDIEPVSSPHSLKFGNISNSERRFSARYCV